MNLRQSLLFLKTNPEYKELAQRNPHLFWVKFPVQTPVRESQWPIDGIHFVGFDVICDLNPN